MAIQKQNRTLVFVAILVAIFLFFVLSYTKKENTNSDSIDGEQSAINPVESHLAEPNQLADSFDEISVGSPASPPNPNTTNDSIKVFMQIYDDMIECLDIRSSEFSGDKVGIQEILYQLQTEFGQPNFKADLWTAWNLKDSTGNEIQIRLETMSSGDETTNRELRYFKVGPNKVLQQVDLTDEEALNPSVETVKKYLNQGTVTNKEKAGFYTFSNGERLEFVENNDSLQSIELVKGEDFFTCKDLTARENCRCVK